MNKNNILIFSTVLMAGIALGSFLKTVNPVENENLATIQPIENQQLEDRVNALQILLEAETDERMQVNSRIQKLTDKLIYLENQLAQAPQQQQPESQAITTPEQNNSSTAIGSFTDAFSSEALVRSGVEDYLANDLADRWNQHQLAQLELRDTAAREDLTDEEFRDAMQALNENRPSLRDEISDAQYDQYLYETGQSNRVIIESIITGSVAYLAGLQAGDYLISYAGQSIFSGREVQLATREGIRGEYVVVGLQRDQQALEVALPRGPLGITLDSDRVQP